MDFKYYPRFVSTPLQQIDCYNYYTVGLNGNCYLSEIYSAIQGEGPLVGVRQLFIRLSACDLRCVWCDTPDSLVRVKMCKVEKEAGSRTFEEVINPIDVSNIVLYISGLSLNFHHSVSFTGGEPLLQTEALTLLIPKIKNNFSLPIYLESGGHRPDKLKEVIKLLDYVSMDFKLPSSAKTGTFWNKHSEFLDISLTAGKMVWVKIVVSSDTSLDELIYAVNLVKSQSDKHNKSIEVFLQPVSEINGSKPPGEKDLLQIHSKLLILYPYIRVLPQVHRLIGQK